MRRLDRYASLVRKWNGRINLVARSTEADLERRHLADSAALWAHVPVDARVLADLGSGGGFPGLVLAILAQEHRPALGVHLVESDARKAAFLAEVVRDLGLTNTTIHVTRIEELDPLGADVITARALAPLERLVDLASRHLRPGGICLFPKGRRWREEAQDAGRRFSLDLRVHPGSETDDGVILQLEGLAGV